MLKNATRPTVISPECNPSLILSFLFMTAIIILLVSCSTGCKANLNKFEYYPDMNHRVSNEGVNGKTVSLISENGKTVFRITCSDGFLFTISPWQFQWLEFVVPSDQLVPGRVLQMADLNAWSGAEPYTQGAGLLSKGTIKIDSISLGTIELSIDAPQIRDVCSLDKDFEGKHLFIRESSPSKRELAGFANEPQTQSFIDNQPATSKTK